MAICDLYLISLSSGTTIQAFLELARAHSVPILSQARVLRWVVLPSKLSTVPLLAHNVHWDLVLVLEGESTLPQQVEVQIAASWRVGTGVPSALVKGYTTTNANLLNPKPGSTTSAPTASSSSSGQALQLTSELADYVNGLGPALRTHPITMLNLLAFNPGKKQDYIKYGQEFSARVGSKHGGHVKLVGHVVGNEAKKEGWDEIAYVHYPTLGHFATMLADPNYQEVNETYRVGALKDTFILCLVEIDDAGNPVGGSTQTREKL